MLKLNLVALKKRLIWTFTGVIATVVILAVMFVAAVPLSSDTLRHRMVKTLSRELNSDVELGDLHLRVFPRMQAEGTGLVIRKRGRTDVPPLISVKAFTVDADLLGLLRKHVSHVQLEGLEIQIPPKDHDDPRRAITSDHAVATMGTDTKDTKDTKGSEPDGGPSIKDGVIVDSLDSSDARLVIIPREKDKNLKVWAIHTLHMTNLGANQSMPYDAVLTNAVPPGEIKTSGHFGPWQTDEPGNTPLDGTFAFDKADLSVFKGIGGTLSSRGSFGGALNWIDVNGETHTPDFVINVGGHPFPLNTKYHTVVDGTNGDTLLEQIDATFLNSSLVAKGSVLDGPKGQKGRTVTLDVVMERARIEDIMVMAVKMPKPPMIGALKLSTKFLLPPGDKDVSEKLRLDGRFSIANVKFTSYDVQGKIDELSRRGRGPAQVAQRESVASNFQGRFKLADGQLALPELTFAVPGSKVELAGVFGLKPQTLDFKGQLLLDAKISETVTGYKSVLLKIADPLFKQKDGTGSAIPIKIGGSVSKPEFGLDVRRVFKKRN
jgi:AsmA-like C-terminal region